MENRAISSHPPVSIVLSGALLGLLVVAPGCAEPGADGRRREDAGRATLDDADPPTPDDGGGVDTGPIPGLDAGVSDAGVDAPVSALGPPRSRPPAGPPDDSAVVLAVAAEHPDWLLGSCVALGGSHAFMLEVITRLRALDPRYGVVVRAGVVLEDRVGYFWGDGVAEGSTSTYVIDVIGRHCAAPGTPPPVAGWIDDSAAGGIWTLAPLSGVVVPTDAGMGMPDAGGGGPTVLPLPNMLHVVESVASDHPDWLAASCVESGGNNDFLFEVVRRLRRIDPRWGLNWKRAVVGDMSQDVVDYYWATPGPIESGFDTYVVDIIGGHCGPDPRPTWNDVSVIGSTGARWTLAGRSDL